MGPDLSQRSALLLYLPRPCWGCCCSSPTNCNAAASATTCAPSSRASARCRQAGVPVRTTKLKLLLLSALFTSVCGSLYAFKTGFVDPESGVGILVSVQMVIIAALGGAGTLVRPAGRRPHP